MTASPDGDVVLVVSAFPDAASAEAFATELVETGAAACVNVLPGVRSVYRWQGSVERSDEVLVLIKTVSDAVARVEALLAAQHPYELPEGLVVPLSGGVRRYLDWVRGSIGTP